MDYIYSDTLPGFCALDLAMARTEVVDYTYLIIYLIRRYCTIYHDMRGLLLINNVPNRFSDVPKTAQKSLDDKISQKQYEDIKNQRMIENCILN